VKFYLIAILFIIFDLELTFLFPWIINFYNLPFFSIFIMFFFLIILFIGFAYELTTGSLDWNVN
jgi:NADH:ubiquinone oxidoreductase subunit 3 (subunit A)